MLLLSLTPDCWGKDGAPHLTFSPHFDDPELPESSVGTLGLARRKLWNYGQLLQSHHVDKAVYWAGVGQGTGGVGYSTQSLTLI